MVMINSRTAELLDAEELRTVLGHEAGHILSDHVLYRTALMILTSLGTSVVRLPLLAGLPLLAVKLALLEWFRAAELSCDRAATLVNRDPLVTSRHADGDRGRCRLAQAQPRRVPAPGQRLRRSGSRAGTSSAACAPSSPRPTRSRSAACPS